MRRFYLDPDALKHRSAVISDDDAKHIRKVLRLKPGDAIRLFDGNGFEYDAVITGYEKHRIRVDVGECHRVTTESPIQIGVALGLLKDRKMDALVRQLTELGATSIIPFVSSRSVPDPAPEKLAARQERWRKIAIESLKQCRRGMVPEIADTVSFDELIDTAGQYDAAYLFWEEATAPLPARSTPHQNILVILGPEGGFSVDEADAARTCGIRIVSLGPRILKADTAPIVACALAQYLFGDMGDKSA